VVEYVTVRGEPNMVVAESSDSWLMIVMDEDGRGMIVGEDI
jgi:hypothetical protein